MNIDFRPLHTHTHMNTHTHKRHRFECNGDGRNLPLIIILFINNLYPAGHIGLYIPCIIYDVDRPL